MNYWKTMGAPAEKLLVGFATYGHSFNLTTSDHSCGAPSGGPAPEAPYTRMAGFMAYYEVSLLSFVFTGY